jgi:hypothetical protein
VQEGVEQQVSDMSLEEKKVEVTSLATPQDEDEVCVLDSIKCIKYLRSSHYYYAFPGTEEKTLFVIIMWYLH